MQWTVKDMEVWLGSFLQLLLDLLGVFPDGDVNTAGLLSRVSFSAWTVTQLLCTRPAQRSISFYPFWVYLCLRALEHGSQLQINNSYFE